MAHPPLTRLETVVLFGFVLLLLTLTGIGVLRDRRSAPSVSFISSRESAPYRINVNAAPPEELALLRGIGPAKARAIVAWRRDHSPFKSADDLRNVPGISDKIIRGMSDLVTFGPVQEATPPPPASAPSRESQPNWRD